MSWRQRKCPKNSDYSLIIAPMKIGHFLCQYVSRQTGMNSFQGNLCCFLCYQRLFSLSLWERQLFFFPKCDKFTGCSQSVLCAASQLLVNLPLLNSPLVPLGKYCLVLYLGMIDGGAN